MLLEYPFQNVNSGASLDDCDEPPRDLKQLRDLIAGRRDEMSKRLTQIADFAVAHPREIAFGRVADVAAMAGVQPSALVRFAQALGFTGYSEMQAVFLGHARERWPDYRERIVALPDAGGRDGLHDLLRGFMRAGAASIGRLDETIDLDDLARAVEILAAAGTIHLLGTRRSYPATTYLVYALRRLGVRCEMVEQAGLGPEQVALMGASDVMLAVSFSPYAQSTLELATAASARKMPIVAITNSPLSPLTRIASVWLEVVEADHAAFRSLAGTFALAATLAVAVAAKRGESG